MRDITLEDTIFIAFTTRAFATGIPTVLAGSPVVSAYEDAGLTQITAGITLGVDHDSVVGLNMLTIVATGGNGFEAGKDYQLVITTGTVGGVSVVGEVVGSFSIGRSAAAIADAIWDEVLTGGTHNVVNSAGRRLRQIQEAGGYTGGCIYIDTVNGVAGTTDFENGVDSNPVDSIADANTLAASLGISKFCISAGSSIIFTVAQENQTFIGEHWNLALGGQAITNSYFFSATVSGIGTYSGNVPIFENCPIGNITLPPSILRRCYLFGDITNSGTGDWFINHCVSRKAGGAAVVFDFGGAVGNTNLNLRSWAGRFQLEAMGGTGTDAAEIEGWGEIIEGTCTGGTVKISGNITTSGITNLTLSDNARIDTLQINAEVDNALDTALPASPTPGSMNDVMDRQEEIIVAGAAATGTLTTTDMTTNLSISVNDQYNGRILTFRKDTATAALRGQQTAITDTVTTNGQLTFTDLTTAPANGDTFEIT